MPFRQWFTKDNTHISNAGLTVLNRAARLFMDTKGKALTFSDLTALRIAYKEGKSALKIFENAWDMQLRYRKPGISE